MSKGGVILGAFGGSVHISGSLPFMLEGASYSWNLSGMKRKNS